jgi:protein Mpv17
MTSRAINATIVLGFGTLAVSRLLTIDHDYWHVSDVFVTLNSVLFSCG